MGPTGLACHVGSKLVALEQELLAEEEAHFQASVLKGLPQMEAQVVRWAQQTC